MEGSALHRIAKLVLINKNRALQSSPEASTLVRVCETKGVQGLFCGPFSCNLFLGTGRDTKG